MFEWSQLQNVVNVPVKPYHPLRKALTVGATFALVAFLLVAGCN